MVFQVYKQFLKALFYRDAMLRNPAVGILALLFPEPVIVLHGLLTELLCADLFYLVRFASPDSPQEIAIHMDSVFRSYFKPGCGGQAFRVKHKSVLVEYDCLNWIWHISVLLNRW